MEDKQTETLDELINSILKQVNLVRNGDFEASRADKTAAASLEAQLKLADFLSDAECQAKQAKHELEYIRAEVAFKLRSNSDKKLSEANLEHLLNQDQTVRDAKNLMATSEKHFKKWQYIFSTLKDAHVFFRTLGKV